MADLSPAAEAVLDAAFTLADNLDRDVTETEMIAAALRGAADQVVPHEYLTGVDAAVEARQLTRLRLLAIAAELENTNV
jgi:propanediol dehydratase small subunit